MTGRGEGTDGGRAVCVKAGGAPELLAPPATTKTDGCALLIHHDPSSVAAGNSSIVDEMPPVGIVRRLCIVAAPPADIFRLQHFFFCHRLIFLPSFFPGVRRTS